MFIDIYYHTESKSWSCNAVFTNVALRQEIESMMGGYGIIRDTVFGGSDNTRIYSGNFDSKDWFKSIFRMYGFKINMTIE